MDDRVDRGWFISLVESDQRPEARTVADLVHSGAELFALDANKTELIARIYLRPPHFTRRPRMDEVGSAVVIIAGERCHAVFLTTTGDEIFACIDMAR